MNNSCNNRFKLSQRGMMLAVVSAALSPSALANTGHVDFAVGSIVVTGANGQVHTLFKGAEVGTGDKITSGADGRAQIRFSDGAYVSLQPNTEFDIKQYRFDGKADGTESALFGLFKGAMRTVTGLVGRVNKSRFQITTPTATIGIRGTGGLIQVGNDGSTLVIGTSGIWSLSNLGGTLNVPAGTAGFAGANVNVPPQPANEGPVVPPPQATGPQVKPTIVEGDVVNSQGTPVSLGGPLPNGPGYAIAAVDLSGAAAPHLPLSAVTTTAIFNSSGQLSSFTQGSNTYQLAGTQVEGNVVDGIIAWGRWTGQVNVNGSPAFTLGSNEGLHYAIGMPTASMPTIGTFTYSTIAGATSPTYANGVSASGTLNAMTLSGNFSTGAISLSGLNITAGSETFTQSGAATGTLTSGNPFFSLTGGNIFSSGGAASCSATNCSLGAKGFFAGTGATHAGLVYDITGGSLPGSISGAAVLK